MPSEREKLQRLRESLRGMGKVAVAYSGGVDSSFLLRVAMAELGENVLAVFNSSDVVSPMDLEEAVRGAREIGVELEVVDAGVMSNQEFLENRLDRCYICKWQIFQVIKEAAKCKGFDLIVDGSHADDLNEDRPGLKALTELGVRSPLAEVGLIKDEIRRLAKEMGMRTADRPANPCLATRIEFNSPITKEKLEQVHRAEMFMHELGVHVVRVRHHGHIARIEVPPEEFTTILRNREKISSELRSLGFVYVDLDLRGYRSGSMCETLPPR